jgi:DNA-binding IclR family transcriptional regulator
METEKQIVLATSSRRVAAPPATTRKAGSISYAFAIIRYLSESGESLGVTAIAKQLHISPSSCFNILKTLVAEEVVEFHPKTKVYTIGYGLLNTVRDSINRNRVLPLLAPGMRDLADKYSMAIGLWRVNRSDRPLLIWIADAEASIRIHLTIGQRLPILAGAVGRCVAAHYNPPHSEFSRLFAKLRLPEPVSQDTYRKEIERARKNGYAVDAGAYYRGVSSVAVPIVDPHGELGYCLSATMFTGQHGKDEIPVIASDLQELAGRAAVIPHSGGAAR